MAKKKKAPPSFPVDEPTSADTTTEQQQADLAHTESVNSRPQSVHFDDTLQSPTNHIHRVPTPPTGYNVSPRAAAAMESESDMPHTHFNEEVSSPVHGLVKRVSTPTNISRISSMSGRHFDEAKNGGSCNNNNNNN
eukprot:PhM_4_TR13354/c0_g1_i1/m.14092